MTLEELKLAYEKAEKEYQDARAEFNHKYEEKKRARREYEGELYKHENCGTCKYSVIENVDGDHNTCGCEEAPCTCCNRWCENYQPDTPLTRVIKDNLDCFIDYESYEGLKMFCGDILTTKGSINPNDGKEYNPTAKKLYDILKVMYREKEK